MSLIFAMMVFSFVMSISPGPVNIIIVSSSINNGFKASFPFLSGATIGFTCLLAFIAFGFINMIEEFPSIFSYLSVLGSVFIAYMGFKILSSKATVQIDNNKNSPKFYEGFILQWLNPKAWMACVSGVSMFSSSSYNLMLFILIYFIICYMSLSFWGLLGQKITILFNSEFKLKVLNTIMGLSLIIIAVYLLVNNLK